MSDVDELHVSGLVLRVRPDRLRAVEREAAAIDGLERVAGDAVGRLALTLECATERALHDAIARLEGLPGVLSVALVYHHHEPLAELEEEIDHENHPT
ncbi:MAG: chaperone NapD [Gammaproteobacteria bacterium]|nr:chaperone NapD [Gammaproteobacteria bacterium]